MAARLLSSICLIAVAASAYGQAEVATQPAGESASTGWVGVLTATNVYVRSGPGEDAYPCAQLSAPDKVTVVGKSEDWLKILPPKGCFSAIRKDYVDADETGRTGAVNTKDIWVRAGGDLRTTDFWAIQCRTTSGDKVEIIGETGDYYKIVPPPGAHFWISARYVRPAGESEPSELEVAAGATRPAATKPAELIVIPQTGKLPTTVPTDLPKAPETSATAAFRVAEKALREEFAKPLEKRDLKGLLVRYQAIQAPPGSKLGDYVGIRVKFLQGVIAELEELNSVREMAKATAEQQKEYEDRYAELQKEAPPPEPVRTFAAKGVVAASEVFPGGAVGLKRYILIDPQTRQVAAYVQCGTGAVDLGQYVGMVIGVFGQRHLDRQLLRYIVEAEEVVVIEASGQIPTPPKPIIRVKQYPEPQAPSEKEKTEAPREDQPAPTTEPSSEGLPVVR